MKPPPSRRTGLLVLVALILLAVNLRPAAVSVGPVLAEVTAGLSLSPLTAGLLTALPVLAFAGVGAVAPWLARAAGVHRTTVASLVALVTGLALRAVVDQAFVFLALSMLALAGMATANVLLPSLVKLHFPDRIGLVTAFYTTSLAIGLTAALMLTVPVAEAFGGWRVGIGAWAVLGLLALLPWLPLVAHDRHPTTPHDIRLVDVARTRLGVAMAVLFGVQGLHAYVLFGWFAQLWRDAGYSPTAAGLLVGLVAAVSIPLSLWLPAFAGRREDHRRLLWCILACYPVAYVGLLVAPYSLAVLWAIVVGVAACTFPLILTLIGMRARTPAGTAALSGFTQSVGYLVSAIGPLATGVLYDATGGWDVPLLVLLALVVPMVVTAGYVGRPLLVEDQLRRPVP